MCDVAKQYTRHGIVPYAFLATTTRDFSYHPMLPPFTFAYLARKHANIQIVNRMS